MKRRLVISIVSFVVVAALMSIVNAPIQAAITDTIQAPTGYFVPTDAQKYNAPYYRWYGEDWGWKHNPIAGTITSATLSISAWDVDYPGEVDLIVVKDNGAEVSLGNLAGADDSWSYTTFNLDSSLFDDIAAGLEVFIRIDLNRQGWAVTLAKSVLSVDGGELPPPEPGVVPEPTALVIWSLLGCFGIAVRWVPKRIA